MIDTEVLNIYNRVTSFDVTIDKALGKYNKYQQNKYKFGKPHKNIVSSGNQTLTMYSSQY